MQKSGDKLIFAPSDLCRFMESPFVSWMDRVHFGSPRKFQPDSDSETDKLLQERGLEHERAFLNQLQADKRDVCDVSGARDRFSETKQAMRSGIEVIYQAALRNDQFVGYADFLIRASGASELGEFHYEPWDTKLALYAKPYHVIQLACYADLLAGVQGQLPESLYIVLGNKDVKTLRTADYLYHYRQVLRCFLKQQAIFNSEQPPDFSGLEEFGRWTSEAERRMEELDHLCRVANIRRVQIKKLQRSGITTMRALASYEGGAIPGMKDNTLSTLCHQARLQIASAGQSVPVFERIDFADGRGLCNLPPVSKMDLYFDMEGYPFAEGGLEYLFGATTIENGPLGFTEFWAHTAEQEKRAFEDFIDWAHSRWLVDSAMHIYHYASYEKTALRRLMGKYATRENELDNLLRNEVLVDLLPIVRQAVRVGTPNYSIKSIERLYREKRHGDVATAIDSVVFYKKWLDQRDGDELQASALLAEIRSYNKEDCDSTYQLTAWLRKLQEESGIPFKGKTAKGAPESTSAQNRSLTAALAQRMLAEIPIDEAQRNDKEKVQGLLAHLLEFHWREAKPIFWAKYDRHAMTGAELFEDTCCLANLRRSSTRPRLNASHRSILYEYEYDADQDTKIDAEDSCFYAHDLNETISVESINSQAGIVVLKRSREKPAPPAELGLILDEFVDASALAEALYRIAESYFEGSGLAQCLEDFLLRRAPRLRGGTSGAPLVENVQQTERTIDVITRMEDTILCIQGPPGSGKTHIAAHAIAQLARNGKRVGITSNSHKVIAKLIDEVAKLLQGERSIRVTKIQSDPSDFEVKTKGVYKIEPKSFFEKGQGMFSVVGGTAWLFSDQRADNLCDYLFVDEAGQVSIANLIAMGRSAKNIVLVGDQMQLSQPLKGSHPGESGTSTLEYLLREQEVVRNDFGIFLGTSRRMHPDVCAFISGAVYHDQLQSHANTAERFLELPAEALSYVKKGSGLIFVPIDHEGNVQDSEEEANVVVKIVTELKRCLLTSESGKRVINNDDILLVAPYNMQVRRLRNCLPDLQAGSVDKFQGQEAPIVIISMCASSGEGLSRGMEFLFSKNRLNVAISRAQTLAVIVGSPALANIRCSNTEQMQLVNLYCRIMETGMSSQNGKQQSALMLQPGAN